MSYAEQYGMINERNIIDAEKFGARFTSIKKESKVKMSWRNIAKYMQNEYGVMVDWDEEFFICPECGEPIYKVDWGPDELDACPVCEFEW